jgi:hypothetical protein
MCYRSGLQAFHQGGQLWHGTHTPDPVASMEWLAFEIEHSEIFAQTRGPGESRPTGRPRPPMAEEGHRDIEHDPSETYAEGGGYLHTYRTTRTLSRLLYIDGMSAGKTSMGTLDSTDYILKELFKIN